MPDISERRQVSSDEIQFFDDCLQRFLKKFAFGFGESLLYSYFMVFLICWIPVVGLEFLGFKFGIEPSLRYLDDYAAMVYIASIPLLLYIRRIITTEWGFVFHTILNSNILEQTNRELFLKDSCSLFAKFDRWWVILSIFFGSLVFSISILILTIREGNNFWFVTDSWPITPSGIYNWGINVTIFLFVLFYWALKYVLWIKLLLLFSRLNPKINATHPDKTGGLGFLADSTLGLTLFVFFVGIILTTTISYKIEYEGVSVISTPVLLIILIYFGIASILLLSPLLCFTNLLYRARKKAIYHLTKNGITFCDLLDKQEAVGQDTFSLLQAQADLAVAYENVQRMKIWPIDLRSFFRFLTTTTLPLFPLLFSL